MPEEIKETVHFSAIKDTPETANNIIFISKRNVKGEVQPGVPPRAVIDGRVKIKLPSPADQLKGFYNERAAQIIQAFPKLYKPVTQKGAK